MPVNVRDELIGELGARAIIRMTTRFNKKTKEVEPEIKDIKQRGKQLTSDYKREGQSLCLNSVGPWEKLRDVWWERAVARMCLTQRKQKRSPHRARVGKLTRR